MIVSLAAEMAALGHRVDIVAAQAAGPNLARVSDDVHVVDLMAGSERGGRLAIAAKSVWGLSRFLIRERPDCLLSTLTGANIVAALARRLARVPTALVIREANTVMNLRGPVDRIVARMVYPWADGYIALSQAVAADLSAALGAARERIVIIHNPVDVDGCRELAREGPDLRALSEEGAGPPYILGAGRLVPGKDFATLIKAFAALAPRSELRLVIIGEGPERARLEHLVRTLSLERRVLMPGFVANPYRLFEDASVFVLSSQWEGFPSVVAEALALGTPVVATDCRSGPAEILEHGRFGQLVPIGDERAMANAIMRALVSPQHATELVARAGDFSLTTRTRLYLDAIAAAAASRGSAVLGAGP